MNFKIRTRGPKKLGPFLIFPHEKTTFQWAKLFLRPYFPLIRSMFVFRSGLRFSFQALKVPELRVRKRSFSPFTTFHSLKSKTTSEYKHTRN